MLYLFDIYSIDIVADSKKKLLIPPISVAAPGPLYQQIVDGIKREISEGRLAPGSPLPSFRGLAEELLVSVITVKRAYEDLEREGIIYRRQGLGTFVSDNGRRPQPRRQDGARPRSPAARRVREAQRGRPARQGRRSISSATLIRAKRKVHHDDRTPSRSVDSRSRFRNFTLGPLDITVPSGRHLRPRSARTAPARRRRSI